MGEVALVDCASRLPSGKQTNRMTPMRRRRCSLLRNLLDMPHFAGSTEYFPLTLTLSLGEREQQASDWCLADGRWANSGTGALERRWTILPLPRGEGRGEGEPSVVERVMGVILSRRIVLRYRLPFAKPEKNEGPAMHELTPPDSHYLNAAA